MNFFNIDMHISIIHDIKNIFKNIGHNIDSVCMSGHTWVNNEKQGVTEIITPNNWKYIDQKMCDDFYNKYKDRLGQYDAFIHSYPPAFALLFEKWNKPIITIACTRFDYPCVSNIRWLIEGLQRLEKNNQLIPIANNIFDQKYCERFTDFSWSHIQSLCDYMDTKYTYSSDKKNIIWKRSDVKLAHKLIDNMFDISKPYNRIDIINKSNGVIHIPYNVSIMSAFEHYYSNVPMFVPTINCIRTWLKNRKKVLSEIYFDPHVFEIDNNWIELEDWLIDSIMPDTIKFDSEDDLYRLIENADYYDISNKMKNHNIKRKELVYGQWKSKLEKI